MPAVILLLAALFACGGEDDAEDMTTWFWDADADGFGTDAATLACEAPAGASSVPGDCQDGDAHVHPAAAELCDGVDQDCDGLVDDEATDAGTWYLDGDADGLGDPATAVVACELPEGHVVGGEDCDDADPAVGTYTWYEDLDGDGFGDLPGAACVAPVGHVAEGGDCDDGDAARLPRVRRLRRHRGRRQPRGHRGVR